jgi:hypothetical protein
MIGKMSQNLQVIRDKIDDAEMLSGQSRSRLLSLITPTQDDINKSKMPETEPLKSGKQPIVVMVVPINKKDRIDMLGLKSMILRLGDILMTAHPKPKPRKLKSMLA